MYSSRAGVGLVRDSITREAQGWRRSARRAERIRCRTAFFQSFPPAGGSISPTTMSTIPSSISSLLDTCLYSAIGTTELLGEVAHAESLDAALIGQGDGGAQNPL